MGLAAGRTLTAPSVRTGMRGTPAGGGPPLSRGSVRGVGGATVDVPQNDAARGARAQPYVSPCYLRGGGGARSGHWARSRTEATGWPPQAPVPEDCVRACSLAQRGQERLEGRRLPNRLPEPVARENHGVEMARPRGYPAGPAHHVVGVAELGIQSGE